MNFGLQLLSFFPPEIPYDLRWEDDDPLGVLFAAEATTQLLLEFHSHRQLRRSTWALRYR